MLINFQEKQRWGYYNSETDQTIPAQFYEAADFNEGYAIVRKDCLSPYGVIDEDGREILSFSYSSISYEGNHIFKVGSSDFNCLYNQYGKIVDDGGNEIPSYLQIYKIVQRIDKDLYHVLTDENKQGVVYEGHLIISFDQCREVKYFRSSLILIDNGCSNQWLYDLEGNQILSEYREYNFVSDRYIIVYAGYGKGYGIVDIEKNVIVEAKYSKIEFIGKDTFRLSYKKDHEAEEKTVKINAYEKCFVLASNNTFVQIAINQEFDWCELISEDHIIVSSNFLYGIANPKGDIVLKCEYDQYISCNSYKNIILP